MSLSPGRKVLFWTFTILFPFVLLSLIEIGLRIGDYNKEAQGLFIEAPGNPNFLISNPAFVGRYFPSFTPKIAPNPFRKEKKQNTFRVFVFGGSSTQGFPYNFYYGFAEQLEQKLLLNTDGVNVEVINLGMTAVNSYVIRDLSKRVIPYDPDAIIIYAGHNEYYGSFGVGTTQFGLVNSVTFKRLILRLKNLRLYQFLENALKAEESDNDRRTMMARVISESNIELDGPLFVEGMKQFEKNIGDVLELYNRKEIPTYIGTVASNLKDQPPMSDNDNALEAYKKGSEFYETKDTVSALKKFIDAKELDGIRFRAPEKVNDLISTLAEQNNAELVDVGSLLRKYSASGIEDESLFIDHLHPNSKGHRLITDLFFEQLLELDELKSAYSPNSFKVPQNVSKFEQTYSNTSISRLLVGYPFQKGLSQAEELSKFQKIYDQYLKSSYIDSVAATAVRSQQSLPMALTEIINESKKRKDTLTVSSHYYELLKWQLNSTNLIEKGIEYAVNDRSSDTYMVNMISQVLNDGDYNSRYMDVLSAVYLLNKDLNKAKYWLDESEKLGSNAPILFYNLARYHILNGDTLKANEYYNRFAQASQSN